MRDGDFFRLGISGEEGADFPLSFAQDKLGSITERRKLLGLDSLVQHVQAPDGSVIKITSSEFGNDILVYTPDATPPLPSKAGHGIWLEGGAYGPGEEGGDEGDPKSGIHIGFRVVQNGDSSYTVTEGTSTEYGNVNWYGPEGNTVSWVGQSGRYFGADKAASFVFIDGFAIVAAVLVTDFEHLSETPYVRGAFLRRNGAGVQHLYVLMRGLNSRVTTLVRRPINVDRLEDEAYRKTFDVIRNRALPENNMEGWEYRGHFTLPDDLQLAEDCGKPTSFFINEDATEAVFVTRQTEEAEIKNYGNCVILTVNLNGVVTEAEQRVESKIEIELVKNETEQLNYSYTETSLGVYYGVGSAGFYDTTCVLGGGTSEYWCTFAGIGNYPSTVSGGVDPSKGGAIPQGMFDFLLQQETYWGSGPPEGEIGVEKIDSHHVIRRTVDGTPVRFLVAGACRPYKITSYDEVWEVQRRTLGEDILAVDYRNGAIEKILLKATEDSGYDFNRTTYVREGNQYIIDGEDDNVIGVSPDPEANIAFGGGGKCDVDWGNLPPGSWSYHDAGWSTSTTLYEMVFTVEFPWGESVPIATFNATNNLGWGSFSKTKLHCADIRTGKHLRRLGSNVVFSHEGTSYLMAPSQLLAFAETSYDNAVPVPGEEGGWTGTVLLDPTDVPESSEEQFDMVNVYNGETAIIGKLGDMTYDLYTGEEGTVKALITNADGSSPGLLPGLSIGNLTKMAEY